MLIPLGTDRPLGRMPIVTWALIGLNVTVFLALEAYHRGNPDAATELRDRFLLTPGQSGWYTFITYAFLHAGMWHIVGNMLVLWVFGPNVEDRFGRVGFAAFYLVGAAAAGGTHALFEHSPVLGASGAVAAVTGAFLVLFPRTRVKIILWYFMVGQYEIPAWWFIGFAVFKDVIFQGIGANHEVALLAHIGGYALGFGVSLVLLVTKILPREGYDLFSIAAHTKRRYDIKEAAAIAQRQIVRKSTLTPEQAKQQEALAALRARVSEAVVQNDADTVAASYRELLVATAGTPRGALLSRRLQCDVANVLFARGEYAAAADAYGLFVDGYPDDPDVPRIRLMLALTAVRYLHQPDRARAAMAPLKEFYDADMRALAATIKGELEGAPKV